MVQVWFSTRDELRRLDAAALELGGVRGATEFRPCYGLIHLVERPHSATYIFADREVGEAFARSKDTA